jgi:hypothetical protein
MVVNINGLLELAFSSDYELGAKALAILEHCNPRLIRAALKCKALSDILQTKSSSALFVNRLASVIHSLLWVDSSAVGACGRAILQLFDSIAETEVASLFQYLCRSNPRITAAQRWLVGCGFVEAVTREIEGPVSDASRTSAYLRLIPTCAHNSVFRDKVCCHRLVSALNIEIGGRAAPLEDARWMALESVYCGKTVEMMRGFFPEALEVIVGGSRGQSCCSALRLVLRMLELDELLRPFVLQTDVPKVVMNLIVGNPDHSILQQECRQLILALLENRATRTQTIADCGPIMLEAAKSGNRNLTASIYEMVRTLAKSAAFKEVKTVPGFGELLKKTKEITDLMILNYGGPIREVRFS